MAIETNEQWQALKQMMGDPAWANDAGLTTVEGRLQHQDELDRRLSE